MRIIEPQKNAHYRINSGISIQGEGTPGQLILIASSKSFLPPKETFLPTSSGTLICQTTVGANGKWVCPNNPVMTAKQAGRFSLYAAQYQELHSTAQVSYKIQPANGIYTRQALLSLVLNENVVIN